MNTACVNVIVRKNPNKKKGCAITEEQEMDKNLDLELFNSELKSL